MPENSKSIKWRQLILLAVIFTVGLISWILHPRAFIWDDSYFYLVIARNIVFDGSQTFSNLYVTNGIHPLWLYLLSGYSYLASVFNPQVLFNPVYAVPLSALLVLIGTVNLWRTAALLRLSPPVFAGLPLAYVLFFHLLYSEAHVYYAALSWLLLLLVRNHTIRFQNPYLIGMAAGLVFLGRLDAVFVVICFLAWYLAEKQNLRTAIKVAVPLVVLTVPYLLSNYFCFGGLTPVSGWLKSSFPQLFLNKPFTPNAFFGYNIAAGLVPIILGICTWPILKVRAPIKHLLGVLLAGSILHFFYTAFFTRFHTLYFWYYIPNVLLLTGVCSAVVKQYRMPRGLKTAGCLIMVFLFCFFIVTVRWKNTNADKQIQTSVAELLGYLQKEKIEKTSILVSDVPGVVAYFTDNNLIAADMVTANRKLYTAMLASDNALTFLMDYCKRKGRPIRYYYYFGSDFIQHDKNGHGITYFDPKHYPDLKPIGRYDLGRAPVFTSGDMLCQLWEINQQSLKKQMRQR